MKMHSGEPDALNQQIAKRLRAARLAAKVSQQSAGDALGVSFQQIGKNESGANRVSAGALAVLAQLYGKPITWFFQDLNSKTEGRDEAAEFLALPNAIEIAGLYGLIIENEDRAGATLVTDLLRRLAKNTR